MNFADLKVPRLRMVIKEIYTSFGEEIGCKLSFEPTTGVVNIKKENLELLMKNYFVSVRDVEVISRTFNLEREVAKGVGKLDVHRHMLSESGITMHFSGPDVDTPVTENLLNFQLFLNLVGFNFGTDQYIEASLYRIIRKQLIKMQGTKSSDLFVVSTLNFGGSDEIRDGVTSVSVDGGVPKLIPIVLLSERVKQRNQTNNSPNDTAKLMYEMCDRVIKRQKSIEQAEQEEIDKESEKRMPYPNVDVMQRDQAGLPRQYSTPSGLQKEFDNYVQRKNKNTIKILRNLYYDGQLVGYTVELQSYYSSYVAYDVDIDLLTLVLKDYNFINITDENAIRHARLIEKNGMLVSEDGINYDEGTYKAITKYFNQEKTDAEISGVDEELKRMYHTFNEKYFNNRLPSYPLVIWSTRMGVSRYGVAKSVSHKITGESLNEKITLSKKAISSSKSVTLEEVLLHEMIHFEYPNEGHGPVFMNRAREITQQSGYTITDSICNPEHKEGYTEKRYIYECGANCTLRYHLTKGKQRTEKVCTTCGTTVRLIGVKELTEEQIRTRRIQ